MTSRYRYCASVSCSTRNATANSARIRSGLRNGAIRLRRSMLSVTKLYPDGSRSEASGSPVAVRGLQLWEPTARYHGDRDQQVAASAVAVGVNLFSRGDAGTRRKPGTTSAPPRLRVNRLPVTYLRE